MNLEQLAFVNQQLAGMLRSGIPLEGALAQVSASMERGRFKGEIELLRGDLASGMPLAEAISHRDFPEFYKRMIQLGARTNDFPAMLTLLADHYQQANLAWTRLKGLMLYPLIVLIMALGLSFLVARIASSIAQQSDALVEELPGTGAMLSSIWYPTLALLFVTVIALCAVSLPALRQRLRWRLPGFRENAVTNFAASMSMMLRGGGNLADALALGEKLEAQTPARTDIAHWRAELAQGKAFTQATEGSRVFPRLFTWLVAQGGEDLAAGFQRAAQVYYARAIYRMDLLLYAALPVSVLILGLLIVLQFFPLMRMFVLSIDYLGNMGQ